MNLILDLKRGAHATVNDESGAPKYLVTISKTDGFHAVVYDDLGVTELLKVDGKDGEFNITAFDVPAGVFTLNSVSPLSLSAKAGDWTVTEVTDGYAVDYLKKAAAKAQINGQLISFEVLNSSQPLMLVAVALIMYAAKGNGENEKKKGGDSAKAANKSSSTGKMNKSGAKALFAIKNIATRGLKNAVKAFKNTEKLFKNNNIYKFSGAALKKLLGLLCLLLIAAIVLFVFGIVNTGTNGRMKETTATAVVSADKKSTTAYFNVAGFQYNTRLKGYRLKSGDKLTVYYTENDSHKLTGFYLKQKPTTVLFVSAVICIVCALGVVLTMLYGVPTFFKNRRILRAIKKSDGFDDPTVEPKPKIQAVETLKPQENGNTLHFENDDETQ